MKIIAGRLIEIQEMSDKDICSHGMWFYPLDGEAFPVSKVRDNTPRNTLIEAYFEEDRLLHFTVLVEERKDITNKDIALVYILESGQTETEAHWNNVSREADRMQAELRRQAKGKWEVKVTPYVLSGYEGNRHVVHADWNWIKDNTSRDHVYYHCWGGYHPGIKGHATRNHWFAWTFGNASYPTMIHEQGHAFGCGHATADGFQYGGTGWMSFPAIGDSFNGGQQAFMKIIDDESIYKLDPNRAAIVYLIDPDSDPKARYPGLWCGVEISKGYADKYMLTVYQGKLLYLKADGHDWGTTVEGFDPTFYAEVLDKKDGIWKIDVRWDKQVTAPKDQPWPELPIPDNTLPLESGLFHEPRFYGQGMDCWHLHDRTIMYWYTVDNRGNSKWYFVTGGDTTNVRTLTIHDPSGKEFTKPIGKMIVYSDKENRQRAWFGFNEGACGVLDLELLGHKTDDAGLYEFLDKDISGLSLTTNTVGYVYRTDREWDGAGWRGTNKWFLASDGILYEVEGVKHRVENGGRLVERGTISWDQTTAIINGEEQKLHKLT